MSVGFSKCCTFSCGDVRGHRLPFLGRHFLLEILSFLLTLEFCKRGNMHKSLEEQLSYVLLITSVLFNGKHSNGKMIEMNLSELNKYDLIPSQLNSSLHLFSIAWSRWWSGRSVPACCRGEFFAILACVCAPVCLQRSEEVETQFAE